MMRILLIISGVIIIFSSCKQEGCTDRLAINYNITADKDDGSCIYCNLQTTVFDTTSVPLIDKKIGSPYYNQHVGRFYLTQYLENPGDSVCGAERSLIGLKLKSNVPETMLIYFQMSTFSGPVNINYSSSRIYDPYQLYDFQTIEVITFPPFYKISMDSLTITLQNPIQYF